CAAMTSHPTGTSSPTTCPGRSVSWYAPARGTRASSPRCSAGFSPSWHSTDPAGSRSAPSAPPARRSPAPRRYPPASTRCERAKRHWAARGPRPIGARRSGARHPGPGWAGRPSSWTGRPSRRRPVPAGRPGRRAPRARPTAPRSARPVPRPTGRRPRPSAPGRRLTRPRGWLARSRGWPARPRSWAPDAHAELAPDPRPERVPEPLPRLLVGAQREAELLLGVDQQFLVDDWRQDRPGQEIADVVLAPGEDPSLRDVLTRLLDPVPVRAEPGDGHAVRGTLDRA